MISDRSKIPKITPLSLASADTEYSHTFQAGTVAFDIYRRGSAPLRYSWATGGVASGAAGGTYRTLPAGSVYSRDNVQLNNPHRTIYIADEVGSAYAEIEEWLP